MPMSSGSASAHLRAKNVPPQSALQSARSRIRITGRPTKLASAHSSHFAETAP
jgi:hypothetical protein